MPSAATPSTPPIPPRVGPYRIVTRIASGGMSDVYLAKLPDTEEVVVIKRMLPHLVHEPDLRETLLDEARLMARLDHPNVPKVHELARDGKTFYLVMEHLSGENLSALSQRLRTLERTLSPALAVYVVREMCRGLHAAHELRNENGDLLNVIHRDISPQNTMVTFEGQVKLLDFGIARYDDRVSRRTQTGICKGKFAYMAPEQFQGVELDRRVDVFALGVVLHELLTGQRLFSRSSELDTIRAISEESYPTPSQLCPSVQIPIELEAICMRAIARDRDQRIATADELEQRLTELLPSLTHDSDFDGAKALAALFQADLRDRLEQGLELVRRAKTPSKPNQPVPSFRRPGGGPSSPTLIARPKRRPGTKDEPQTLESGLVELEVVHPRSVTLRKRLRATIIERPRTTAALIALVLALLFLGVPLIGSATATPLVPGAPLGVH